MRTVLVIGRRHGKKKLELVTGPSSDGSETGRLLAEFKKEIGIGSNKSFELLELWDSGGGRVKSRKFITESEAKKRAEANEPAKAEDPSKADAAGSNQTMKAITSIGLGLGLLFGFGFGAKAQDVQYLLNNSTVPIGLSNIVTCVADEGTKIAVQLDVKLTGAGTDGIACALEASNNNTNWSTTPVTFWRAATGSTAVTHLTNFDIGPYVFLRWKIHNTNTLAVTNSTITMINKKEYR